MPKSRLKKKSLKSKLTWIFISLAIFLGGSVYAAFSFGSGPLTGLLQSASINRVVVEDPNFAKTSAERKAINELNNAANQEARAVTNKQKAAAESRLEKAWNDLAKIEKAQTPANLNTTAGDAQSSSPPAITPPVASTPPTVNKQSKPDSCEGGNGVKLTPGKYAATGYGWTGTGRDLNSGAKQRECVYIDENCNHGPAVACDVVYKEDPTKVILPVSAGKEYYAGLKDDTPKPKENCYDQSGVIMVTGSSLGDDVCFNGEWLSDKIDPTKPDSLSDLDNKIIATCDVKTQAYDMQTNQCITPVQPVGPTPAEIAEAEAKADEAKQLEEHLELQKKSVLSTLYNYESNCILDAKIVEGKCIPVQGGGYGIVPKNSNITAISYNSGSTAGRPTSFTGQISDTTYQNEPQCKTALRAGEECIPISNSTGTGIGGYKIMVDKPFVEYTFGASPAVPTNNLTADEKSKLNEPTKPWAANNPVLVKKESDCPDGSNIDSVYLPNTDGPTFRCTPKANEVTVPVANPGNNPRVSRPLTPPSSTFVQTTEGALGGAAIGGTVGALVCGGLAWGFGSLTFGGTIILAPAAAGYCATLGAGLGATIGGINSYESAK